MVWSLSKESGKRNKINFQGKIRQGRYYKISMKINKAIVDAWLSGIYKRKIMEKVEVPGFLLCKLCKTLVETTGYSLEKLSELMVSCKNNFKIA